VTNRTHCVDATVAAVCGIVDVVVVGIKVVVVVEGGIVVVVVVGGIVVVVVVGGIVVVVVGGSCIVVVVVVSGVVVDAVVFVVIVVVVAVGVAAVGVVVAEDDDKVVGPIVAVLQFLSVSEQSHVGSLMANIFRHITRPIKGPLAAAAIVLNEFPTLMYPGNLVYIFCNPSICPSYFILGSRLIYNEVFTLLLSLENTK